MNSRSLLPPSGEEDVSMTNHDSHKWTKENETLFDEASQGAFGYSNGKRKRGEEATAPSIHAQGTATETLLRLDSDNQTVPVVPPFYLPKAQSPRPYGCATCTRSFARLEHLRRHERSHNSHKPFQCPDCTRCFARRDLLYRHQARLHNTRIESTPSFHTEGSMATAADHVQGNAQLSSFANEHHETRRRACSHCRLRKIRCTGGVGPRCQNCIRLEKQCDFNPIQQVSVLPPARGIAYCIQCKTWNNSCSCGLDFSIGHDSRSFSSASSASDGDHQRSDSLMESRTFMDSLQRTISGPSLTNDAMIGSQYLSRPSFATNYTTQDATGGPGHGLGLRKKPRSNLDESWSVKSE